MLIGKLHPGYHSHSVLWMTFQHGVGGSVWQSQWGMCSGQVCSVTPSWDRSISDTNWGRTATGDFACAWFYVKCCIALGNLTLNVYTNVLAHNCHIERDTSFSSECVNTCGALLRYPSGFQIRLTTEQCLPLWICPVSRQQPLWHRAPSSSFQGSSLRLPVGFILLRTVWGLEMQEPMKFLLM